MGAFLGHLYPLFFRFAGGKGVATSLGVFLALDPWIAGLLAIAWVLTALVCRYSSVAALTAAVLMPMLLAWRTADAVLICFGIVITCLLAYRHRGNIVRLLDGTEPKIALNKKRSS